MRIGIDARKAADYGIGTHVRNLVHRLVRLDRSTEWVFFHRPGDEGLLPAGRAGHAGPGARRAATPSAS